MTNIRVKINVKLSFSDRTKLMKAAVAMLMDPELGFVSCAENN